MKLITSTLALLVLACFTATAQVNPNTTATASNIVINGVTYAPVNTNLLEVVSEGKEYGGYEVTFGGGGTAVKKESSSFGIDLGVSSNPFKKLPNLWVGINQGVYFEPSFSGSTDLYADWNTHLIGELYVNTGWSVGSVYDKYEAYGRTGPKSPFSITRLTIPLSMLEQTMTSTSAASVPRMDSATASAWACRSNHPSVHG